VTVLRQVGEWKLTLEGREFFLTNKETGERQWYNDNLYEAVGALQRIEMEEEHCGHMIPGGFGNYRPQAQQKRKGFLGLF
jgi:hypothetical protein